MRCLEVHPYLVALVPVSRFVGRSQAEEPCRVGPFLAEGGSLDRGEQ